MNNDEAKQAYDLAVRELPYSVSDGDIERRAELSAQIKQIVSSNPDLAGRVVPRGPAACS